MDNDLTILRKEIDVIDKEIFALLGKRFEVVKKVGDYKKERNLPIRDKQREVEIISKKIKEMEFDEKFVREFFQLLFKYAYLIERTE